MGLKQWFRKILLKIGYPIIKLINKVELPKRKISYLFYHDSLLQLEIGDILVTKRDYTLTNLLIPGKYKHVAIYIGYINDAPYVIEAIGKGVTLTSLGIFLLRKDHAAILDPIFASKQQKIAAAEEAKHLVGRDYDNDYKSGNEAFYCAEIVWFCYDKIIKPSPFILNEVLGEKTITPDDFYNAKDKWKIKIESK